MKTLFVILFYFLLFPQHDSEKINWAENRKLTWEDFQAKQNRSAGFVASTSTGIGFEYSYSIENNQVYVKYSVECFFSPDKSWYIPEKVTQHVLNHEQAHFDISELHGRILRKRLSFRKFSKKVKNEIETIYLQVEEERKEMQKKFDSETNHSQNIEKEILWEQKIAKQLAQYESWK